MEVFIVAFDWSAAIAQLSKISVFDYFKARSMPAFVEPLVTELVDWFNLSSEIDRQRMLAAVTVELSTTLGWYARKLAGRSVRDHSQVDLKRGLVAIAISTRRGDSRDALAPLSLLCHSAVRLEVDPATLFEAVSIKSTRIVQDLFRSFLNREPEKRAIETFGFHEGVGPHGFDYIPLLPEYGGPTPFLATR